MGRERVTQIRLAVQKGERPTNWTDQRGFNKGRDPAAHRKVDAFLEFAYQHIAEPMADARVALAADTTEHGEYLLPSNDEDVAMDENFFVTPDVDTKPVKYIPPCSTLDFYDTYCQFEHSSELVSLSTFRRVLHTWRKALKFRRVRQHSKCSVCAKLQKMRKEAATAAEREFYQEDLTQHLRQMFMDRAMDARFGKLSEESALGTLTDGTVLSIAMDGMDQAKFRCPPNICNANDLESLWRPVLHVTGVLTEGIGEFY